MKNDVEISYAEKVRVELGISHEQNTVLYRTWNGEEKEGQIFFGDQNDNLNIRYLDAYGNEVCYYDPKNNPKPYIVQRPKVANGKGKYKNPPGAPVPPFIPPPLITKVKSGIEIDNLIITEGAKKAFAASVNGLDCIGISGIFQFKLKDSKELHPHPYILEIINACKVKNVVLLFDADALNLTSHDDTLTPDELTEKDLAYRGNLFAAAGKNFKEACLGLNICVFIGYINPKLGPKGLDDVFIHLPNDRDLIISDILMLSKACSYFTVLSLKDNSYSKLNTFFGIDNEDNFYKTHQDKLGLHDFNYRNKIYRYNDQTGKVEISENDFIKFYTIIYDDKGNITDVKIDPTTFLKLLTESGHRVYRLDVNNFIYVRIKSNVVSIVSTKDIKEFVLSYVNNLKLVSEIEKHHVTNKVLLFSSLFSREILEVLITIPGTFHTDTSTQMFFYFENGFVEVTKQGICLKPYEDLDGYIWESEIIQKDYVQPKQGLFKDFPWVKFVNNICSIKNKETDKWEVNKDRLQSFYTILGYILHRHKKERKAILFTDTEISGEPEGRTGKSLIAKAAGQVRPYAEIDGKNYDQDNSFKNQNVNIDTEIVHLNDVGRGKKKFDFELMFTAVTEGITVEKKHQPSFVNHSVIIISSNRAIEINGGSAKARVIEFEFANYYSDTFSPKDEFGIWFFDEWDQKEWNLFYYFLFNCCKAYFADGVVKPASVNLDKRKLIQATGNTEDFLDFAEENFADKEGLVRFDLEFSKRDILARFKLENPEFDKLTSQAFTKWLDAYAIYKKVKIEPGKKSGGDRHIKFVKGKTG